MEFDQLREQTCFCMDLLAPELGDSSVLVDECLSNARLSFRDSFICEFRPEAWAKITLIYHKYFLDNNCDVSVAEIITAVVRDAINSHRIDFLTMSLAQQKLFAQDDNKPVLSIVKPVKDESM